MRSVCIGADQGLKSLLERLMITLGEKKPKPLKPVAKAAARPGTGDEKRAGTAGSGRGADSSRRTSTNKNVRTTSGAGSRATNGRRGTGPSEEQVPVVAHEEEAVVTSTYDGACVQHRAAVAGW